MAEFRTARCRSTSCRAEIVWAVTAAGKKMPVDAAPGPGGLVELTARPGGAAPLADVVPAADRAGRVDLHHAHHETCADRARWRPA